jgi:glycosyltransferase involved in cell wall biosynthesis
MTASAAPVRSAPAIESVEPRQGGGGSRPKDICLVTGEFVGLWRNGGIGTATAGLAETLVSAGHRVTLCYTKGFLLTPRECRRWTENFAAQGLAFLPLRPEDFRGFAGPLVDLGLLVPAVVLRILQERRFDIVHFNDLEANGYLAVAAKRCGLDFGHTVLATGLHSPTRWINALNRTSMDEPLLRAIDAAEQAALRSTDILWCPSRYLVDWAHRHGLSLPDRVIRQQYVMPQRLFRDAAATALDHAQGIAGGPAKVTRLVFFGRLEERKGLGLFLDALDRLGADLARRDIEVVFLGRPGTIEGRRGDAVVRARARTWPFRWRMEAGLGQADALKLLQAPGSLAVMASPEDNSPCTVYEAIENHVPFVASRAGGIPELVHPDDHHHVLFEPSLRGLAERIAATIETGAPIARPAVGRAENAARWRALHDDPGPFMRRPPGGGAPANLLVIIDDSGGADAAGTRESLPQGGLAVWFVSARDAAADASLAKALAPRPAAALLVRAGVICDPAAIARMGAALAQAGAQALLPAVATIEDGRRIDPPPLSLALLDDLGPLATGLILIAGGALSQALEAAPGGEPFSKSILRQALLGGTEILPYPSIVARVPKRLLVEGKRLRTASKPMPIGVALRRAARRLSMRLLTTRAGAAIPYAVKLSGR